MPLIYRHQQSPEDVPASRRNMRISRAGNLGANTPAVNRHGHAQQTAQSIAANRLNARNIALQNVHEELDQLAALPPHEEEFVVERLVPARVQPLAQSWIPRVLRRNDLLDAQDEPMTAFEYAHGRSEQASNPQRIRVAEQLRGWLLPDIIAEPDKASRIIAEPTQNEKDALIVVSDHRSWGGGLRPHYTGPTDAGPPNMIGVIDNNYTRWGSQAIEGMSAVGPNATEEFTNDRIERLHQIADALATARQDATNI